MNGILIYDEDEDGRPGLFALAPCIGCHRPFTFNPDRVPILLDGVREPICAACVVRVNPRRIANGLEPIVPLPGAYKPQEP